MHPGTLYVVSTPIGNLEDISLRALRVLKEADIIAAEDTRHSLKLLSHYGISKPMIGYWGERERGRAEQVIERLKEGRSVALISDAGTPGISDPGAVLVRRAIEEGISVVPVPGPSAVMTALSLSGFRTDEFVFIGFLPAKAGQRRKKIEELSLEARTVVFFEAPHRIIGTLEDMSAVCGQRRAVLIREMTKIHEEVLRGDLSDISRRLSSSTIAGEYVCIVEGKPEGNSVSVEDALSEVASLMKKGLGRKDAVRRIAETYGLSRKELYDRSLGTD